MNSIKSLIQNKPSKAIQAMIDGLVKQDKRWFFRIDMHAFNYRKGMFMYGCAATCALQEIMRKNLPYRLMKIDTYGYDIAKFYKLDVFELSGFMNAMNRVRMADLRELFTFCSYPFALPFSCQETKNLKYQFSLLPLTTETWKKRLYQYRVLAEYLRMKQL